MSVPAARSTAAPRWVAAPRRSHALQCHFRGPRSSCRGPRRTPGCRLHPTTRACPQTACSAWHARHDRVKRGSTAHLRAPGEVPVVQAQRAELGVAAAHAHAAHAHVRRQLGHRRLAAQLIPAEPKRWCDDRRAGTVEACGGRRRDVLPYDCALPNVLRSSGCSSTRSPCSDRGSSDCTVCRAHATHFRFLRHGFCLPPVARRLWSESREIPADTQAGGLLMLRSPCIGDRSLRPRHGEAQSGPRRRCSRRLCLCPAASCPLVPRCPSRSQLPSRPASTRRQPVKRAAAGEAALHGASARGRAGWRRLRGCSRQQSPP